jgi:hypothetical protein
MPAKLADFGAVNISSASAKGITGITGADGGTSINMTDDGGDILSEENDESRFVGWVHCSVFDEAEMALRKAAIE